MAGPTTVIVTLSPKQGCVDEVEQIVAREIAEIRQATGCEVYDLYRSVDDEVILIERWSSRDTWQAHFDTPAISRLKNELTPLLAKPAERVEMYPPE